MLCCVLCVLCVVCGVCTISLERTVASLRLLVHSHRYRLRQAFEHVALAETAKPNRVSVSGWASAMSTVLGMETVDWLALQPHIAPKMQRRVRDPESGELSTVSTEDINFVKFLQEVKVAQPELAPVVLPGPKSCSTGPPGIMVSSTRYSSSIRYSSVYTQFCASMI
jgi:hypothetical protein